MSTNTLERSAVAAKPKLSLVDCDIHPNLKSEAELFPFMERRWVEHAQQFGPNNHQGLAYTLQHPRFQPAVSRADAWPPGGGPPGSDLDFLRSHHLDAHGIAHGLLMLLRPTGCDERNLDFAAALCAAANDWQRECWVKPEPRLHGGIMIPQEDPAAAVKEIERCARTGGFAQVNFPPRALEPPGRRRYWSIYEAAVHHGFPVGLHVGGVPGHPTTGAGMPTYYLQEHHSNMPGMQAVVSSFVFEGVFERLPELRIVLIEGGFAWSPALCWRMDRAWRLMRAEVPQVPRPPSEYVRDHVYYTTQPIEEPDDPAHLGEIIDWIGHERIMFSTDYPHWDFDDPRYAFRTKLTEAQRAAIFGGNARALYRLP
ncbi:amidohydrolase family protein [Falsiroseomonas oryzae]|uniref:amidohydrolase family protein n=1 Tax=Falsiroseomonas oryzae TaxID=2766473 RepID=UPI0022EB139B|nr:amidohydrolase family protein [Roseomonas sp. MO-31]